MKNKKAKIIIITVLFEMLLATQASITTSTTTPTIPTTEQKQTTTNHFTHEVPSSSQEPPRLEPYFPAAAGQIIDLTDIFAPPHNSDNSNVFPNHFNPFSNNPSDHKPHSTTISFSSKPFPFNLFARKPQNSDPIVFGPFKFGPGQELDRLSKSPTPKSWSEGSNLSESSVMTDPFGTSTKHFSDKDSETEVVEQSGPGFKIVEIHRQNKNLNKEKNNRRDSKNMEGGSIFDGPVHSFDPFDPFDSFDPFDPFSERNSVHNGFGHSNGFNSFSLNGNGNNHSGVYPRIKHESFTIPITPLGGNPMGLKGLNPKVHVEIIRIPRRKNLQEKHPDKLPAPGRIIHSVDNFLENFFDGLLDGILEDGAEQNNKHSKESKDAKHSKGHTSHHKARHEDEVIEDLHKDKFAKEMENIHQKKKSEDRTTSHKGKDHDGFKAMADVFDSFFGNTKHTTEKEFKEDESEIEKTKNGLDNKTKHKKKPMKSKTGQLITDGLSRISSSHISSEYTKEDEKVKVEDKKEKKEEIVISKTEEKAKVEPHTENLIISNNKDQLKSNEEIILLEKEIKSKTANASSANEKEKEKLVSEKKTDQPLIIPTQAQKQPEHKSPSTIETTHISPTPQKQATEQPEHKPEKTNPINNPNAMNNKIEAPSPSKPTSNSQNQTLYDQLKQSIASRVDLTSMSNKKIVSKTLKYLTWLLLLAIFAVVVGVFVYVGCGKQEPEEVQRPMFCVDEVEDELKSINRAKKGKYF